jgi:hypothetical protein
MKTTLSTLAVVCALAAFSPISGADPPPKPACGTSGSISVTAVSPALYTYTLGEAGGTALGFTVSSPSLSINPSCDSSLPAVFGNGKGGANNDPAVLPYELAVTKVEIAGIDVDAVTDAAVRAALSAFQTAPFKLTSPGSGSQGVSFSFTNSAAIPIGMYDVTIAVQPETGRGVGSTDRTFTIQVEESQVEDTLEPTVNIIAPTSGDLIKLNDNLPVDFTALDPPEGGAGTGVTAVRAEISACAGAYAFNLTPTLSVSPLLPVAADVLAEATTSLNTTWLGIGSFALTAEADDGAGHTGSATATFAVGTTIAPLPPISVPNRQFNAGSTVPVKFMITDVSGAFLPPMDGLIVRITTPSGAVVDRVAGSAAENVRWELDDYGNATQYLTNFQVPATGTYSVQVLVADVCGDAVSQGAFSFVVASKGGKQ